MAHLAFSVWVRGPTFRPYRGIQKSNNNLKNLILILMAHNLNFNARLNRHAFVSVKEKPWHNLGVVVENKMTSIECIKLAGLDFNVVKVPNYADVRSHLADIGNAVKFTEIPDSMVICGRDLKTRFRNNPKSFSTIRTDTYDILGTVGSDYHVVDNREAFDFFDGIVGSGSAIYETAGALGNGETIFLTAKIPKLLSFGGGKDTVERYLVLSNTHDGSRSLEAFITNVRVVCNNTLAVARSSAACRFRIRHTKNASARIEEAREILGIEEKLINAFAMNAAAMIDFKVTEDDAKFIIAKTMMNKAEIETVVRGAEVEKVVSTRKLNQMTEILGHVLLSPGADLPTARGTLWGVYNGFASYHQNGKDFKSSSDKTSSLFYGDSYNKITSAYNTVLDFMAEAY